MREGNQVIRFSSLLAAACVFGFSSVGRAAITVDGNLDADYGSPLTTQTINTGFGTASGGDSINGSELDAGYGVVEGGNLFIFLAGNTENNGNHVNLFIDGGAAGQSTLSTSGGTLATMNGSQFSPGFQATYALDTNDYAGTFYTEEYTYGGPGSLTGGYVGGIPESNPGIAVGSVGTVTIGVNNTHVSTMGSAGTATNQANADSVSTGLEFEIPLSSIGYTGGNIQVMADVNGGGDGYLSNQFLPGLPTGTGNLGTSTFNFSSTPGQYFTVAVPEPASLLTLATGGLLLLRRRPAGK
jgi:hypothetical protein